MPHRPDLGFQTELVDHICHLFTMEGVRPTHVREIMWYLDIFDIWCIIPRDMRLVMCHVVGTLMLI